MAIEQDILVATSRVMDNNELKLVNTKSAKYKDFSLDISKVQPPAPKFHES